MTINPITLAQDLIRRPSVTPADEGALDVLQQALTKLGFVCRRLPFSAPGTPDIDNLYARLGTGAPHFCFAGHSDVVPVGPGWTADPFAGAIENGILLGRGAADMKGAIAAFAAAADGFRASGAPFGSISLLITGDEEGPAINGTKKVLDWMAANGEIPDACLVGEPTNPHALGEMIKIGRRGSVNMALTVRGAGGHVAYPHLADNPAPKLVRMLARLTETPLDSGTEFFQPSNLEITTIDIGNPAANVIPAQAKAAFNIRFNDLHGSASLTEWVRGQCGAVSDNYDLDVQVTGEAFLTPPGDFTALIADAVRDVTGRKPDYSTTGGTSDARFIKDYCPVAEFGLVGQTMHKADEQARVEDIENLARIYGRVLERYFSVA